MSLPVELNTQLDALEAWLPALIRYYPGDADFWPAFAGEADVIEDQAGEHLQFVHQRIDAMLAKFDRHPVRGELAL